MIKIRARISKTEMNDVPSVPIGDFENTLSFPSEETSLGSGLRSHLLSRDVPCPLNPSHGFLHHTIANTQQCNPTHAITLLEMLPKEASHHFYPFLLGEKMI
jgi:hypothetical protein